MRARSLVVALFSVGCHAATPSPPSPRDPIATPAPPTPATGIAGDVIAPEGSRATGRLVLTWRTPDEERAFTSGNFLGPLRQMIARMTVSPADVDLGATARVPYSFPEAPRDAFPVAIFDVGHTFWATFEGAGEGLTGTGPSGGGAIRLAPNPKRAPSRELCAGDRYKLLVLDDAALGKRRFCAYLPASWATKPERRYPVVLLLPGFGSTDLAYLVDPGHAGLRLDAISKETAREAILVGVDTSTPLGSTYLEDSPATGPWDTFLAERAIPFLDRELRVLPRASARAVLGQSTGGFNALSFGLRHSDRVSAIGASSPDPPDIEPWLLEPGTRRAREWLRHWTQVEAAVGGAGQVTSWAASWSPDPAAPRGFRYPIDPVTGVADEPVLARWTAKSPHALLRDPALRARAKKDLGGRVFVSVGRNDEFDLFAPAEAFARELDAAGVTTRFVPTDHGHGHQLDRFEVALRFLLERLDAAEPR